MGNTINTFRELKEEKEKLKAEAAQRIEQAKNSLHSATTEGKSVMVNKILIPAGIALVAGYGVKKLVDYLSSEEKYQPEVVESDTSAGFAESRKPSAFQSLLSRVNWSGLIVQLVPFVISVGKKMYEEGQLPYFNPPEDQERG